MEHRRTPGMLTLVSPAKVNLFLRILGKRADGYHELASLFQAIDLFDTLHFSLAKEDTLTCSDPTLSCDHTNLVIKALNLFRRKSGLQFCMKLHLEKRIPTQAGLGGGSGNAATTLWALNALHNFKFSENELQTWSSEIGSDIPFFFSHGTAYCTGRGEKVRDLPKLTLSPLSLFKPPEGVSTPEVYKALNLQLCAKIDPEKLLEDFYSGDPFFLNDLEEPAFRLLPLLRHYKTSLLEKGCSFAVMSGSGSSFLSVGASSSNLRKSVRRAVGSWYEEV